MEKFKEICNEIVESIPSTLKWEMDDRFDTTLIGLDVEETESVHENLCNIFGNCFDHKSIKKSSKPENKLSMKLGGVDKGQFLFTSMNESLVLFCAWWPWGDKSKVSLRVGLFDSNNSLMENSEIVKLLKEWFLIE